MQTHPITAATAIPVLLVIAASVACWAGVAALATGLMQSWNIGGL